MQWAYWMKNEVGTWAFVCKTGGSQAKGSKWKYNRNLFAFSSFFCSCSSSWCDFPYFSFLLICIYFPPSTSSTPQHVYIYLRLDEVIYVMWFSGFQVFRRRVGPECSTTCLRWGGWKVGRNIDAHGPYILFILFCLSKGNRKAWCIRDRTPWSTRVKTWNMGKIGQFHLLRN